MSRHHTTQHTIDAVPGHNRIIDLIDSGRNELYCECGTELLPACDMSWMSIYECFTEHRASVVNRQLESPHRRVHTNAVVETPPTGMDTPPKPENGTQ